MKRNRFIAAILSLLVPGLNQIYGKKVKRGAFILIAVIIVGNLNAVWLSVYALAGNSPVTFWGHVFPRILHAVFAFYGILFWIWQTFDAYHKVKQESNNKKSNGRLKIGHPSSLRS